eukprot:715566-Pyramimonas_sp.AAC.1
MAPLPAARSPSLAAPWPASTGRRAWRAGRTPPPCDHTHTHTPVSADASSFEGGGGHGGQVGTRRRAPASADASRAEG